MNTVAPKPVIKAFSQIVQSFSDRKAVVDQAGHLTYGELDKQSDELADLLLQRNFGEGQLAVILMNRRNCAIMSMLAVLKAGGAYLPLEPAAPYLRNKQIVIESGASVILTTSDALRTAGESAPYEELVHMLDVETGCARGSDYEPVNIELGPDAAYVIYTSGSTGTPKGAINCHTSVLSLVQALRDEIIRPYENEEALNIALLAPFVFDPSVQQIYSALLFGHTLHVPSEGTRLDGRELLKFFNQSRIDISDGTPTHLKILGLAPESAGNQLGVKHFIIGGEPMPLEVVKRFWNRFSAPQPAITNIYGVAECCVDVTHYPVKLTEIESLGFVPIGKPFKNMSVVVLDEKLNPVREGESGELCIGPPAIGNGYLGKPALTAERFVTNPADGTRLYRTGDKVRKLADGSIEFLGRQDRQVKLRGFRIELGEIESVIRNYRLAENSENHAADKQADTDSCRICVLTSKHPRVKIENGVCSVCKKFETYEPNLERYFQTENDFARLMEEARRNSRGEADVLLLYSGGKDSTYVLFRLIEMGYKVDTFTFDNGFISKTAFENIHRVTSRFGIRHVNCTMNNMKTVFAESLGNSSTVCNGCFRALTMLSTKIAHDRGINVIVTGLSRGQIFDTKLKMLYENGIFDPDEIDRRLMVHRKIFYSQEDTVSNTLKLPNDESNFHIHYADFFRYSNISAPAIRKYLATVDNTWVTPKDTGLCSTNCMINNVGIYVHKAERGYHNYAEPLSWDIRLGVTQREDALRELHEDIDLRQVENILNYLNYKPKIKDVIEDVAVSMREGPDGGAYLIGWFVSSSAINTTHLRQYLATRVPDYMVPRYLIRVNAIPSTHNGKIDYEKLPVPETEASTTLREGNSGDDELSTLTGLWEEVLGVSKIGMDDNFFDLGGQSLAATILVGLIEQQLKQEISVIDAVRNPTIRKMATLLGITTGNGKNATPLSARTASMS